MRGLYIAHRAAFTKSLLKIKNMSNRELWQNALVQIELGTTEASFRTWFRNTDIAGRDGSTVQVAVPSKIVKEWLMEKHSKLILKALRGLDTSVRAVEYVIHRSAPAPERRLRPRSPLHRQTRQPEPPLYVRNVRRRALQPARTCRREGRTRTSGSFVQPAFHLRRDGARQDAPHSGDRESFQESTREQKGPLRDLGTLRHRLHQRRARRSRERLQGPVPSVRCPHHGRRPVHREHRENTGGALPPFQCAPRQQQTDRILIR